MITLFTPERLWTNGGKIARGPDGKPTNWRTAPVGLWLSEDWDNVVQWSRFPPGAAAKEEHGGCCFAKLNGGRCKENVRWVTALGIDGDESGVSVSKIHSLLRGYRHVVYTTFNSTVEAPRWRAIVDLSRHATGAEHYRYVRNAHANLAAAGVNVDHSAIDPCRLWYLPSLRPGGHWEHYSADGDAFDVEAALVTAADLEIEEQAERERTRATIGSTPTVERVRRYIASMDPAISGSGGHRQTFRAACVIAGNVDSYAEQEALLAEYNLRCQPPWSKGELAHKLDGARKADLRPLADRPRRAS